MSAPEMDPGANGFRATGDLDEVSIWKKALPIAEIWAKASFLLQPH